MAITLNAALKLMDGLSTPLNQAAATMERTANAGTRLANAVSQPISGDFGASKLDALGSKLTALQGQYDAQTAQLAGMDRVYEGMVQGAMAAEAEVDKLTQRQVSLNQVMASADRGSMAYTSAQMELMGMGERLDQARQKFQEADAATNKYFETLNRAAERQANLEMKIAGTKEALGQAAAAHQSASQQEASARQMSQQAAIAEAQAVINAHNAKVQEFMVRAQATNTVFASIAAKRQETEATQAQANTTLAATQVMQRMHGVTVRTASASVQAANQAAVAKAKDTAATMTNASAATKAAVAQARAASQARLATAWVKQHHAAQAVGLPVTQKATTLQAKLAQLFGRLGGAAAGAQGGVNGLTGSIGAQNGPVSRLISSLKGLVLAYAGFSAIKSILSDSVQDYTDQQEQVAKLAQTMSTRSHATPVQLQAVVDTTTAQQQIGVLADEVQTAGAQKLAGFVSNADNLNKMIPVMNDLTAAQYGMNASMEQSEAAGALMGKVLNGNVNLLKRQGFAYTDAQEKLIKTGTEEQRVAALTEILSSRVAGMNAALAQTDVGQIQNAKNMLGEVKEQLGFLAIPFEAVGLNGLVNAAQMALPYIEQLAISLYSVYTSPAVVSFGHLIFDGVMLAVQGITWLLTSLGALVPALYVIGLAVLAYNLILGVNAAMQFASGFASGFRGTAEFGAAAGTAAATGAQWGLNAALLACPIAWIIIAIVALIGVLGYLIVKFQVVRDTIARVMGAIAGFVGANVEIIVNMFQAAVNGIIGMINAVIDGLNALGLSIGHIQEVDWASKVKGLGANMAKTVEGGVKSGLDKAADFASNFSVDGLTGKQLDTGKFGELPKIAAATGAVADTVGGGGGGGGGGKAVNTKDTDKEDTELLKMLVEYGKAKNIQNFITLQPSTVVANNKFDTTVQADPDVLGHQIGLAVIEEALVLIPEVVPV